MRKINLRIMLLDDIIVIETYEKINLRDLDRGCLRNWTPRTALVQSTDDEYYKQFHSHFTYILINSAVKIFYYFTRFPYWCPIK